MEPFSADRAVQWLLTFSLAHLQPRYSRVSLILRLGKWGGRGQGCSLDSSSVLGLRTEAECVLISPSLDFPGGKHPLYTPLQYSLLPMCIPRRAARMSDGCLAPSRGFCILLMGGPQRVTSRLSLDATRGRVKEVTRGS